MTRRVRRLLSVVVVTGSLVTLAPLGLPAADAALPPNLAGLPARFGIGVSAQPPELEPGGWVTTSGVRFDYVYQYLAAGVNTGQGWRTWNDGSQFPLLYARSAKARGAIPVFPYYMLYQSNGPCGACGEAQRDLANLNTPTLMRQYFADFTKLMQRLGPKPWDGIPGYGGTAIVQVEPDLSGYAQQAVLDRAGSCYGYCTGQGNSPSFLRASVASSGFRYVSAYANNFRGFSLALLHLRDVFAPNVKLAFHVSNWTTRRDIGSDPDPTLDPVAHGKIAGAFAAASGVKTSQPRTSTYDLIFNDVADRDAGYYKYVVGRPNVFWDRRNVALPNFRRWERFLATVAVTTGRRAMVWQVPVGNQISRAVDNTDGHYQDNRVEYFFAHVSELVATHVMAVLFGRGNAGSTTNTDDKGDGVRQGARVCTTDGQSSGSPICNDRIPTVADDDGGFLRTAAAQYYTHPVPL